LGVDLGGLFDFDAHKFHLGVFFHEADDLVQRLPCVGEIARYDRDPDGEGLMYVLGIYLRDGGIEASPCFVDQTAADFAFVFEGGGVGDVEA